MRFWDRIKWCVIGGAGYALGRYLFQLVQTYIGGYADIKCRSCCLFCEHFLVCSETLYAYWATLPWKM